MSKIFGGVLLVAGTCIGAGMLALPISTAAAGFYPSVGAFLLCWFMMTCSAFLMLEVSLWYPGETNLITMAKSTLGKKGEMVAWCAYVLFLYALMTAYTSGAAGIIAKALAFLGLNENSAIWIVVLIFAFLVYLGARWVDWANRCMMVGLVGAYLLLVITVIPKVTPELLQHSSPQYLWTTGTLLVTSFGFHLLIPSLKNYLQSDVKSLRRAIFWGSIMTLIIYLLWEMLILGVVAAKGERGLVALLYAEHTTGKQAVVELTSMLSQLLNNPKITLFTRVFSLCAILTSFIGVSLGLFDFFADGLKIKKTVKGKFSLATLTFFPPILIVYFYPNFLVALHYAGMFAAILLIIFPAAMVWQGRYQQKIMGPYRMMGGKVLVLAVLMFGVSVIVLEGLNRINQLPTPITDISLFE